jgi:hypothetical protein
MLIRTVYTQQRGFVLEEKQNEATDDAKGFEGSFYASFVRHKIACTRKVAGCHFRPRETEIFDGELPCLPTTTKKART